MAAGSRVTVTTAATLLASGPGSPNDTTGCAVQNMGAAAVDIGGSGVTSGAGFPLAAGASLGVDLGPTDKLYAIAASGTVSVAVLTTRIEAE